MKVLNVCWEMTGELLLAVDCDILITKESPTPLAIPLIHPIEKMCLYLTKLPNGVFCYGEVVLTTLRRLEILECADLGNLKNSSVSVWYDRLKCAYCR